MILIGVSGATANNYRFAGEQFDPNLDQYYLRQRYYNQNSGRFTRRDTYEGNFEDPMSLHKYLYGNANPVTYTDPTGLYSQTEVLATLEMIDTLVTIGQFAISPSKGITDVALLTLDIFGFPPGMAKGLQKLFPDRLNDMISGFVQAASNNTDKSAFFAANWLKGLGHPPFLTDKSLQTLQKKLTMGQGKVVDVVAKNSYDDSLILLVEAKSNLSKTELTKSFVRGNSNKFDNTINILERLSREGGGSVPEIKEAVVTYRGIGGDMGDWSIGGDGLLYQGGNLVTVGKGIPVRMQQLDF
jgi:RHS repeat-associated protein